MRIDNDMGPFKPKPNDPALELVGNKTPITLKNIKFSAWASEETHCFQATIYMDGERAMKVSNEGHGGPNQYYHTSGQSHQEFMEQFNRAIGIGTDYVRCKESKEEWEEWINELAGTSELLDWLVNDLMNEHFILKEMRTKMKKTTFYYNPKEKAIFLFKHKPTPEALDYFRKKNPDVLFLNELPEAEACYYWRKF